MKEYLNKDPLVLVLLFVLVVVLFIFAPLAVIWSLNTLFPVLDISYNFYTWVSVVVLGTFVRSNVTVKQ